MDWLWSIFLWSFRLPWIARLAVRARLAAFYVLREYQKHPPGYLRPRDEARMAAWANEVLTKTHTLVNAYIHHRALAAIGRWPGIPYSLNFPVVRHRSPSRQVILMRLGGLFRRLATVEAAIARRVKLYRSRSLEEFSSALSTRFPREGGGPDSARRALISCRLLFALTREAGSPPARATRLIDAAPRDGPYLRAKPPKTSANQPKSPQRLAA
jgi:hypothetical protein